MKPMKTLKIDVIKRNRKYFACKQNGYKCKLVIDDNSKDLSLGTQELLVNDISKRTKYGTDVIYELVSDAKTQEVSGIVTLTHRYNSVLVEKCRNLGGRFDSETKTWVFSEIVEDKVEELDFLYNSEPIPVEITAKKDVSRWHGPVDFLGYTIATAWGRDSGAKLGDDISLVSGLVSSGGSVKNWGTYVWKDSVIRLTIPLEILRTGAKNNIENWKIRVIKPA